VKLEVLKPPQMDRYVKKGVIGDQAMGLAPGTMPPPRRK